MTKSKDTNNIASTDKKIIDSINGLVYATGNKIGIRAWLDIGSKEWQEVNDDQRKKAYNTVKASGWRDEALKILMLRCYTHLNETILDYNLKILQGES